MAPPRLELVGVFDDPFHRGNITFKEYRCQGQISTLIRRAAFLTVARGAVSGALSRMFLHISAEQSIDAGLIAWPLLLIPFQDIAIDPDGELCFPGHRLQAPPDDGPGEHLRGQFRDVRSRFHASECCLAASLHPIHMA